MPMPDLNTIDLTGAFVELVRRASTMLPPDMEQAIRDAKEREEPGFLSTTAAAGTALELKLNLRRVLKLVMVGKGIGG